MYDIPGDFDPKIFIGGYLAQIAFGVGTIHCNFEISKIRSPGQLRSVSVVSNSYVRYIGGGIDKNIKVGSYLEIGCLGVLLNEDITRAVVIGKRTLRIEFGTKGSIQIEDDGISVESYVIYLPEGEIIVV